MRAPHTDIRIARTQPPHPMLHRTARLYLHPDSFILHFNSIKLAHTFDRAAFIGGTVSLRVRFVMSVDFDIHK